MTSRNYAAVFIAICLTAIGAHAGTDSKTPASPAVAPKNDSESIYDQIWGLARLYKNDNNPYIQELAIAGRYHGQYHWTEADSGSYEDWENRRFRLGLDAKIFHDFEVRAQFESDDAFQEVYSQFTELYLAWNVSPELKLTVGRQKPRFTHEWDTSSRNLITFERSMLVNQFKPNYTTGISAAGKIGNWIYYTGVFDNGAEETLGLGNGVSAILTVGYDFKEAWGLDTAEWRVQGIYSSHTKDDRIWLFFDTGLATNILLKKGRAGFMGELLYGEGDIADAFGVILMPTYDLTKKLQLVARYQFAISDEPRGLVSQRRYELESGGGPGDQYQAAYLGLNYRIYGDKLKLMTGVEYANMNGPKGFEGWTYLSGIRVYW